MNSGETTIVSMINVIREDLKNLYKKNYDWELLKDSTVLITGGYGMLASYIVFFLIYLNEVHNMRIKIICQGRNPEKMAARFGTYISKEYFHEEYFTLNERIPIKDKVDYIFHAASPADPSWYEENPVEVEEPNVLGTYFLLNYAKECNSKGFLYFSSGDVYGEMNGLAKDITEDMSGIVDPLDPHSCYGESKRMGETWCVSFYREYSVPVKIARIGHTYGPTMDVKNDPRVFSAFVKNVMEGQDIVMHSDGTARRPFCYIADATAAFFLLILRGKAGEAYNVCNTQQFISIAELAEILISLCPEKKLHVITKERVRTGKYMEAAFNRANKPVEAKLKELGWECDYSVKEGFRQVLKALLAEEEEHE